jgi:hypothetical protein
MPDTFSLFSINNLLTARFIKSVITYKTTIDLLIFLFSFRFEVNENRKISNPNIRTNLIFIQLNIFI